MERIRSLLKTRQLRAGASLRQRVTCAAASALHASGAIRWGFRLLRKIDSTERLVVLAYRKVAPTGLREQVDGVSTAHFESQVRVVRELLESVPAEEAEETLSGSGPQRARYPVLFTFDDGYQSTLLFALPVLGAWQVPSIVFAPTGLVGTERLLWTDEVRQLLLQSPRDELLLTFRGTEERHVLGDSRARLALTTRLERRMKRLPYYEFHAQLEQLRTQAAVPALQHDEGTRIQSWEQLRRLPSYGAAVGTHSSEHMILANLPDDVLEEDLRRSQERLQEQLGTRARVIAYPNGHAGDVDARVCAVARRLGAVLGFTMEPGIARAENDPMRLPRLAPGDEPGPLLALELLRRLARDVLRDQVRALLPGSRPAPAPPPRLSLIPGARPATPPAARPAPQEAWSSAEEPLAAALQAGA